MATENTAPSGDESPKTKKVSLYAAHEKAYPRFIPGKFRNLKWLANLVLLIIYFGGSWLRWSRGSGGVDQAILVDLPGRRAYFFFIEIWPQEVYYITGLLIIAALSLFFISALLGRIWCGFACWQTVFTELFVWVEMKIQGDRNARIALDKGPLTGQKIWKKTATYVIWAVMSALVGYGFAMYFADAPSTTREILSGEAGAGIYGAIAIVGGFCFLLAGFAREQVCIYMCPYSRFQGAMFDEHSLIVSYEAWRGEPRGPLRGGMRNKTAAEAFAGRGHCVDCKMCVQACPTGIDIRNGSQLACIGCGLCIDACNTVMDRFGLPHGLITLDSSYNQDARAAGLDHVAPKLVRPRTILYFAVICLVGAVMLFSLTTRARFDVNVLHERTPVYVELSGFRLRNGYTIKVLNMEHKQGRFLLSLEGLPEATLSIIGIDGEDKKEVELDVAPDSVGTFRMFVTAPKSAVSDKRIDLTIAVKDLDNGKVMRHRNIFAGPDK